LSYTPAPGEHKVGNPFTRVNAEVNQQKNDSGSRRQGGGGGEPR